MILVFCVKVQHYIRCRCTFTTSTSHVSVSDLVVQTHIYKRGNSVLHLMFGETDDIFLVRYATPDQQRMNFINICHLKVIIVHLT